MAPKEYENSGIRIRESVCFGKRGHLCESGKSRQLLGGFESFAVHSTDVLVIRQFSARRLLLNSPVQYRSKRGPAGAGFSAYRRCQLHVLVSFARVAN